MSNLVLGVFLKNIRKYSLFVYLIFFSCNNKQPTILETTSEVNTIKKSIEHLFSDSIKGSNFSLVDTAFLEVVDVLSSIPVLLEDEIVFSRLVKTNFMYILPIEGAEGYCSIFLKEEDGKLIHVGGSQQHNYLYSKKYNCLLSFSKIQITAEGDYANCTVTFFDKEECCKEYVIQISDETYQYLNEMEDNIAEATVFFNKMLETIISSELNKSKVFLQGNNT